MKSETQSKNKLLVTEIFHSLQGETSLSGIRFAFIRLTGCNLRCKYCDSEYAFKGGIKLSIEEILLKIADFAVKHVLLTGGEPLLQRPVPLLIDQLNRSGYTVSIETHGEVSIKNVSVLARIVMDIKTPGSGMNRGGFVSNLPLLKPTDEIKFVITSRDDYVWAKNQLKEHKLDQICEVLFSPVVVNKAPDPSSALASKAGIPLHDDHLPTWVAERIIEDKLNVRYQSQLHKWIWGKDRTGV